MTPKAVIYCRVSTAEQAERGTSLESQREVCAALALTLGAQVVKVCEDAGVSGTRYQTRPGICEALRLIEAGEANLLLATKLDRIGRSATVIMDITNRVDAAGAELITTAERFDKTPTGRLLRTIFAGMAEMERENIRERAITGKNKAAQQGRQPSRAWCPYGYHIVTKEDVLTNAYPAESLGTYQVVQEEARVVREIFTRYAGGETMRKICKWLAETGVPSPQGKPYWHNSTLAIIFENPVYKGIGTHNRTERVHNETRITEQGFALPYQRRRRANAAEIISISAPAIVDEATWNACQERRRQNKELFSCLRRHSYLLTGFLYCPVCAARLVGGPDGQYRAYSCQKCRTQGRPRRRYGMNPADRIVTEIVLYAADNPALVVEALYAWTVRQQELQPAYDRQALLSEQKAIVAQEKATITAQIAGIQAGADPAAYAAVFAQIAEKRETVRKQLAALDATPTVPPQTDAEAFTRALAALRFTLTDPKVTTDQRKAVLSNVLRTVTPNLDGKEYRAELAPPCANEGIVQCILTHRNPLVFCVTIQPHSARFATKSGHRCETPLSIVAGKHSKRLFSLHIHWYMNLRFGSRRAILR